MPFFGYCCLELPDRLPAMPAHVGQAGLMVDILC